MNIGLQDKEWKDFRIGDIFSVSKGIFLPNNKILRGESPYITAKSVSNGVTCFIGNPCLFDGNSITIGKIDLSAFYQPKSFYCSHDVSVITNEFLNKHNGKFICTMINRQGFKYSYGRQAQLNVVTSEKIFLPINSEGEPDYIFMEKYIKQKEQIKRYKYKKYISRRMLDLSKYEEVKLSLSDKDWGEFFLNEVFKEIIRGKRLKKSDHKRGGIPYVSSTAINNGVDGFIGNTEKVRMFSNCLTIANSGSVGACFYQPFEFVASDHVTKLENKTLSKEVLLFILTIVGRLGEKYSFNREMNDTRIKREKIMLPKNKDGEPDYFFMENYIKKIEFDKLTNYIKFLESEQENDK